MATFGMLADWIGEISESSRSMSFFPQTIEWVDALPPQVDEARMIAKAGTVVVCENEDDLNLLDKIDGTSPVILLHASAEAPRTFLQRTNAMLVKTSHSKGGFSSILQQKIRTVEKWEHDLDKVSAERGSYQDMLDLSRDILSNPITITDSTYQLVAHTPNMATDDPITNELIEKGYHGEEALARFRETGAFAKWEKQKKTAYSESGITKYPSMNHVFTLNDAYFIHMVMTCSNASYSQGLLNTFDILVAHVKAHIRRSQTPETSAYTKSTGFLLDLIEGKNIPRRIIEQHMKSIGFSAEETLRLYAIRRKPGSSENLDYIAGSLNVAMPSCHVVPKKDIIYLVAHSRAKGGQRWRATEKALGSLVDFAYVDIASSGLLPSLTCLNQGAKQIAIAFKYGKDRPYLAYDKLDKKDEFFRYENSLFDYLLFGKEREMPFLRFCLSTSVLARMNDGRQKTPSDKDMLRCYLKHECSVSTTAEALGIHRNTVANRIESIAERHQLDFDDPKTRINLATLFHLSDLVEANSETSQGSTL